VFFSSAHPAQACILATLAALYRHLFSVCINGKIPNLKLVSALQCRHAADPIYQQYEPSETWAPRAGVKIRMMGAHFRDLARDEDKLEVCSRKARGLQQIDWVTY